MLFRVCEHYYDEENINYNNTECESESNICFVCHEINDDDEIKPFSLKIQLYNLKTCDCDGWIHKSCLNIWCKKYNKCPICRVILVENSRIAYISSIGGVYTFWIFVNFKKGITNMFKIIVAFFFIYMSIEFYLTIFYSRNYMRIAKLDESIY